jgi:hypothetical protein
MFTAVPEFEWSVCRQKYQFTATDGSKRRLEAAGPDFDRKQPLAINALFALFADASTESKMLEFCNRWGLPIGIGAQTLVAKNRFLGRIYSASVRELMKHQARMRRAVAAFERDDLSEIMNICNVTESVVSTRLQLRRDANGKLKLHYEPPNLLGLCGCNLQSWCVMAASCTAVRAATPRLLSVREREGEIRLSGVGTPAESPFTKQPRRDALMIGRGKLKGRPDWTAPRYAGELTARPSVSTC